MLANLGKIQAGRPRKEEWRKGRPFDLILSGNEASKRVGVEKLCIVYYKATRQVREGGVEAAGLLTHSLTNPLPRTLAHSQMTNCLNG